MSQGEKTKPSWTPPDSPFRRPPEFEEQAPHPDTPLFVQKLVLSILLRYPTEAAGGLSDAPKGDAGIQRARLQAILSAMFGNELVQSVASTMGAPKKHDDVALLFRALIANDPTVPIQVREDHGSFKETVHAHIWLAFQQLENRLLISENPAQRKIDRTLERQVRAALDGEPPADVVKEVRRLTTRFKRAQLDQPSGAIEEGWPELQYLNVVAVGRSVPEEQAMHESLRVIQAELAKWGIAMDTDPIKLGLASLWDNGA